MLTRRSGYECTVLLRCTRNARVYAVPNNERTSLFEKTITNYCAIAVKSSTTTKANCNPLSYCNDRFDVTSRLALCRMKRDAIYAQIEFLRSRLGQRNGRPANSTNGDRETEIPSCIHVPCYNLTKRSTTRFCQQENIPFF